MRITRFIRFCLVGGTVTLTYYALLIGFTTLGLHYVAANSLGWFICVSMNFLLNRRFTFKQRGGARMNELTGFAATYALQYLVGTSVLILFVEVAGLSLTLAFLITLLTTTLLSYASLARFVFRGRSIAD
ncbi:MAG: hypothetical protein BGP16_09950 [Sphingobium sp. 66-54]|nr:MAG: hypothetical protein BGP16_09950 [Sphingobium sp. 66-54]